MGERWSGLLPLWGLPPAVAALLLGDMAKSGAGMGPVRGLVRKRSAPVVTTAGVTKAGEVLLGLARGLPRRPWGEDPGEMSEGERPEVGECDTAVRTWARREALSKRASRLWPGLPAGGGAGAFVGLTNFVGLSP